MVWVFGPTGLLCVRLNRRDKFTRVPNLKHLQSQCPIEKIVFETNRIAVGLGIACLSKRIECACEEDQEKTCKTMKKQISRKPQRPSYCHNEMRPMNGMFVHVGPMRFASRLLMRKQRLT
jgi:hypothetical protein